jgi:hypothetical protein
MSPESADASLLGLIDRLAALRREQEAEAQALHRALAEAEAEVALHRDQRRAAAEINDTIIQGLVLAGYAMDRGDAEAARGAMGRVLAEARAPVADAGAVVGDQAGASLALGRVVQVGAPCPLGALVGAVTVGAAALASDAARAVEAATEQGPAHRRLRAVRRRSSLAQGGQRSPNLMGLWQPRQSAGLLRAPVGAL